MMQGNDSSRGAIDNLHDPVAWVSVLFDGGLRGYCKFTIN
jgi:hypothetical protein